MAAMNPFLIGDFARQRSREETERLQKQLDIQKLIHGETLAEQRRYHDTEAGLSKERIGLERQQVQNQTEANQRAAEAQRFQEQMQVGQGMATGIIEPSEAPANPTTAPDVLGALGISGAQPNASPDTLVTGAGQAFRFRKPEEIAATKSDIEEANYAKMYQRALGMRTKLMRDFPGFGEEMGNQLLAATLYPNMKFDFSRKPEEVAGSVLSEVAGMVKNPNVTSQQIAEYKAKHQWILDEAHKFKQDSAAVMTKGMPTYADTVKEKIAVEATTLLSNATIAAAKEPGWAAGNANVRNALINKYLSPQAASADPRALKEAQQKAADPKALEMLIQAAGGLAPQAAPVAMPGVTAPSANKSAFPPGR